MSELLRSLASHIRGFVGNRRHALRTDVRLSAGIVLLENTGIHETNSRVHSIEGYTRDVSATGIGLIVPAIRIGGRYLAGEDKLLRVTLATPAGAVTIDCAAVRYEKADETSDEPGYLIGLRIVEVKEEHRQRWEDWLKLKKRPSLEEQPPKG